MTIERDLINYIEDFIKNFQGRKLHLIDVSKHIQNIEQIMKSIKNKNIKKKEVIVKFKKKDGTTKKIKGYKCVTKPRRIKFANQKGDLIDFKNTKENPNKISFFGKLPKKRKRMLSKKLVKSFFEDKPSPAYKKAKKALRRLRI